jgi:hypothetical protein
MPNTSTPPSDWRVWSALIGGTAGAAGWIYGALDNLLAAPAGSVQVPDLLVVLLCFTAVLSTGVVLLRVYASGRAMTNLFAIRVLLGASLLFGTVALLWLHARGVLAFALQGYADRYQPGGEICLPSAVTFRRGWRTRPRSCCRRSWRSRGGVLFRNGCAEEYSRSSGTQDTPTESP